MISFIVQKIAKKEPSQELDFDRGKQTAKLKAYNST